jgi:hypothetical protein
MKTAVEWLVYVVQSNIAPNYIPKEIVEQAKEMEKQQIVEAHGNKLKKSKDEGNYEYWFSGEDYYNKTFKKTEQ